MTTTKPPVRCADCGLMVATDASYRRVHDERACSRTPNCWCRLICWHSQINGGCWTETMLRAEVARLRALVKEEDRWPK